MNVSRKLPLCRQDISLIDILESKNVSSNVISKVDETDGFVYRCSPFKEIGLKNVSPHTKPNNCSHGEPTHGACGLHCVLFFRV